MENENKNSKKSVVIIIVLLLVIASLVGYIVVDKCLSSSNGSNQNSGNTNGKENVEEKVSFSDSELEKYVNYIKQSSIGPSALLYNTSYVNVSNLSTADKIKYIGLLVYSKHTSSSDYMYDIIAESDVKNALEEVYGPNSYEKTAFNLGCGDYALNEADGKYYSKTGCGGMSPTSVTNSVIDYTATKSKLEITTAYVFFDGSTNKIYKDYDKTIALGDYSGSDESTYMKEYIKNNKSNLYHIVYTFESKDGKNYYFTGFTNNK